MTTGKFQVPDQASDTAEAFIAKWRGVTASELSTSQSFLHDLCGLLEVPRPHATAEQDYMFEPRAAVSQPMPRCPAALPGT